MDVQSHRDEERGPGVSHDMEAIFGQAQPLPDRLPIVVPIVSRSVDDRRPRTVRRMAISGAVLAGALALAIGLIPQGKSDPIAQQIVRSPAAAPEIRQVVARVVPAAIAERGRAAKVASNAPKRQAAPRLAAASCGRLGGNALARCMRPQVLAADRQLRSAYRHAVRRGVDRHVLVAYRDDWSSLRRRANSDPRRVTAAYRRMAVRLDAARAG
jgi:hypothetical protein